MTLTLAPPERAGTRPPVRDRPPARTGGASSWRLAARLARREVRRRPGRTALVTTLVALPVAAMTFASVTARTVAEPPAESFAREFGAADVVLDGGQVDREALRDALPGVLAPAARFVEVRTGYAMLIPADTGLQTRSGQLVATDLTDPMIDETIELSAGRPATAPGEALVSGHLAAQWNVQPGDELNLVSPAVTAQVVGVAEFRRDVGADVVALSADAPIAASEVFVSRILADLDRPLSPGEAEAVRAQLETEGRYPLLPNGGRQLGAQQIAWGWVAGALALGIFGIVVTAAFATSARRQLVTLGQLAANGAPPRLLRRTLALQGVWSGLLGALVGVCAGGAAAVALRSTVRRVNRWDPGPIVVSWSDLAIIVVTGVVAATVAAFVPARTAGRIPVLAALAGRKPVERVRRRLAPIGLALFAGGVVALAAVAAMAREDAAGADALAVVAVLGGLAVLGGTCCASPLAAAAFGRVARQCSGAPRLAARGLARTRTRSAAVVAAIAAVGAAALAVALVAETVAADDARSAPGLPPDVIMVSLPDPGTFIQEFDASGVDEARRPTFTPLDDTQLDLLTAAFPEAEVLTLRSAVYDPAPYDMSEATPGWPYVDGSGAIQVADESLLDLIGLSDGDRAALEQRGALYLEESWSTDATSEDGQAANTVELSSDDGTMVVPFTVAKDIPEASWFGLIVTPATATRLGMDVVDSRLVLDLGRHVDDGDRRVLADLEARLNLDADERGWISFMTESSPALTTRQFAGLVALGGGLLALAVVAVALWLTAAESRSERRLLAALGASPRTMRTAAAVEAWLLTTVGMVLAVPTGLIPTAVVQRVSADPWTDRTLRLPWPALIGLVLVLPLVAAGAAWSLSALGAIRRREVSAAALAAD